MTKEERIKKMHTGELSLAQALNWASRAPHEVPKIHGEFAFIAMKTPEIADADD